jgi:RNA polymerase sigma-70 factor (ECF subfamily)
VPKPVNNAAASPSKKGKETGNDLPDAAHLVERARAGDEAAFGEIVTMYHQRVYSVAYRFVQNAEDAADLSQQAWIKAWSRLPDFQGRSAFFTWMYRIVSSTCLDHLRKVKRRAERELKDGLEPHREAGAEPAASVRSRPDRELEHGEIRERFQEALSGLSDEHRMAIVMREVDGASYEEIARAMGCRKGTVMSRLFYARQKLRESMGELR